MSAATPASAALDAWRHALAAGRLAHAHCVTAASTSEAIEFALRAAALLLCRAENAPCGVCRACADVSARMHADLTWVEPEKKSRAIGVEAMRALEERVYRTAFLGGWKVCVVQDADRMTAAAANAFLKTLEEPPPQSLLLLLSAQPDRLLTTILSRCQRVALSTGALELDPAVRETLLNMLAAEAPAGALGALAQAGRVGGLLHKLHEGFAKAVRQESKASGLDETRETLEARAAARYKAVRRAAFQAIALWERDRLLVACGVGDERLHYGARATDLRAAAAGRDPAGLLVALDAVQRADEQLERNLPEALVLEQLFLAVAGSARRVAPAGRRG